MCPGEWPGVNTASMPGAISASPSIVRQAQAVELVVLAHVGLGAAGALRGELSSARLDRDGDVPGEVAQAAGVVEVQVRDGRRDELRGRHAVCRERLEQRVAVGRELRQADAVDVVGRRRRDRAAGRSRSRAATQPAGRARATPMIGRRRIRARVPPSSETDSGHSSQPSSRQCRRSQVAVIATPLARAIKR